jgi:magnesium-transporting ATPase (P-type)
MKQKTNSDKKLKLEKIPLVNQISRKDKYTFYIYDNERNKPFQLKNNTIDQSKYNIITFLPKSLLFQFFRLANVYFLVIAIIQSIPSISPLSPSTAIAPLVFVVSVSIIREGIEDLNRHKYDNQMNGEKVIVFRENEWKKLTSGNLMVGELVFVRKDETFPADLILLDSNLPDGACFIETGTLDGEKTLKNKFANKTITGKFKLSSKNIMTCKIPIITGKIECEQPSADLYKFDGIIDIKFQSKKRFEYRVSLDAKQILLKGSLFFIKGAVLRNTDWILGIVVYTGHNTKLILNSKSPRQKLSYLELLLSKLLVFILILQIIFCIICAIAHSIYNNVYVEKVNYKSVINGYLPLPFTNNFFDSTLSYFTYLLLLNTMIPISLIITLEICKMIQGYFIQVDCELYSFNRDKYKTFKIDFAKQAPFPLMKSLDK